MIQAMVRGCLKRDWHERGVRLTVLLIWVEAGEFCTVFGRLFLNILFQMCEKPRCASVGCYNSRMSVGVGLDAGQGEFRFPSGG